MTTQDTTDYKALISFIMHDLREINAMIRDSARLLSISTSGEQIDEQAIRHHASLVVEQAALLSSWLAICDMHIDPDKFAKEPKRRISLHQLFHKAQATFKRIAKSQNVTMVLKGEGKFYVDAHPIMDILPYVLLDNAVKYSPPHGRVAVTLGETLKTVSVQIASMGPKVEENERSSLCIVGFRGDNAKKRIEKGYGNGLGLLKSICDYHNAKLEFIFGDSVIGLGGIPYAEFSILIVLQAPDSHSF